MKISILSPDLSNNCLGRAYLLAKILQRRYEVEIAGPIFGDGIWKPVADDKSITYKSVKISGRFKPYLQIKELAQKIEGNEKRINNIFGLQRFPGDTHMFGYNFKRLKKTLEEAGFKNIQNEDPKGYHTKDEPCLRIECVK